MFDDLYVPVHSLLAPDVPDAHECNDLLADPTSDTPERWGTEPPYSIAMPRAPGCLDGLTDA